MCRVLNSFYKAEVLGFWLGERMASSMQVAVGAIRRIRDAPTNVMRLLMTVVDQCLKLSVMRGMAIELFIWTRIRQKQPTGTTSCKKAVRTLLGFS